MANALQVKVIAEGANGPAELASTCCSSATSNHPRHHRNAGVSCELHEWLQNNTHRPLSESQVKRALARGDQANYKHILDIAADRPRVAKTHNSKRYTIGLKVPPRVAAMALALQRLDHHYRLEGFSH